MTRWSIIYVIITSTVFTVSETNTIRWYQGCYDLDLGSADPSASGVSGRDPVACCVACKTLRSRYAAVVGGASCQCLSTLPSQPRLSRDACTISCQDDRLWCGGPAESSSGRQARRASVYVTSGPYLLNVTSHVMEPASYVMKPVSVKSVIHFGGPPNITAGLRQLEGALNRVNVTCQTGGDTKRHHVVADSTRVRSDCVFIFTDNGTFHIDITARTVLSVVTTSVTVTVHLPVPQGLQLSLVTPTQDRPSCTPDNATVPDHEETVLVFANEAAHFEASLSVGENLTFQWTLNDHQGDARTFSIPDTCVDRDCTTSRQEYVFTEEGRYKVKVTATSDLGSLSDDLHVIVVTREVSHVTVTCQEPATGVMVPMATARFLVTMVTTDRQNTTLEVDYGDGDGVATYVIASDRSGRMLGIPQMEELSDQVLLTADYGAGCLLRLEIDHVYVTPGVFTPVIHVRHNHTVVSVTVSQPITVQELLLGLTIQGPMTGRVGKEVTFVAEFTSQSHQATITWTITSEDTEVIYNDTSTMKSLTYEFQTPGLFTIEVKAENDLNSKHETIGITIHEIISDLQLTLSGKPCIKTGETMAFNASVAQGSGVVFEWDFGDADETNDSYIGDYKLSSVRHHTFSRPGLYVIEVVAFNDESLPLNASDQLIVEDPVETLLVETSSPTLLGEETLIEAVVTEGTGVKFLMTYNRTVFNQTGSAFRASWRGRFELGVQQVEVVAHNNVSSLRRVVEVEVQKGVEKVAVLSGEFTVIGEKAIFEARLGTQDLLSNREDLLYTWKINDELAAITGCPVIDRVFTTLENVRLEVNVSNKVSSSDHTQIFTVRESSDRPRFVQGAVWDASESTVFQLIDLPPGDELRTIKMKSCKKQCPWEDVAIAPNVTWSKQYSEPGVYEVDANIVYKTSTSVQVRTVVVVQERIVGLTLAGPTAMKLYEMSPEAEWRASVESGTHEIYNWTVLGRSVVSTSSKYSWRFQQAGTYNVSVNVSNSLGWEVQSSTIIAEYPIVRLELKVVRRLRGEVSPLTLIVHGGPMTVVNVSLGNGSALILEEGDSALVKEERMGAATGQHGPTTKYTISLSFENVGHYHLVLNASNHVSYMVASKVVVVEEPITGVRVRSASESIVRRGTTVVVNATVATGKNLTFDWDFSDEGNPTVHTHNNVSVARHVFEEVGQFAVTVYVTGPAHDFPIIAHLPFNFTVEVPIEDVAVYKNNGSDWASLQPPSNNRTATTGPVYFTAEALRGSNVQFTFDFGDGMSEVVPGETSPGRPVGAEVSHNYTQAGTYVVRVTASNPLGTETSGDLPLHVQVPPAGLHLLRPSHFYRTALGNWATFRANVSQGSGVRYDWDMGDQTEYKNAGRTVRHQYKAADTFRLVVKAYNKAGSKVIDGQVEVTQAILGVNVSIIDGNPHRTKEIVRFRAIPYPEHVGVEHYVWDFGERDEPELQVSSSLVQYTYGTYGTFTVHVKAFNAVGHKMSLPQQVQIVQPLTPVQLNVKGETLIGQVVRLEAYHYEGSDVNYTWDFGDGISTMGGQVVLHTYHKVGKYVIRVTAANPFGNRTDSKSVFVLTRPCAVPDIVFHGEQWAVVARTQAIKQEADVRINCSLSSSANYTWSIRNSETNQPVLVDEFLHDPVLYLPRRTLEYHNYTITLRVDMDGTIVYSTKDTNVKVVATPLVAVISGGVQRQVARNETVVLNGSTSHDPDYPAFSNLSYQWGCYQLLKPELSCFAPSSGLRATNTTTSLTIPGRAFVAGVNDFVFNLSVRRPGRQASNTSQVLGIEDKGIIDVSVKCPQCEDTIVNSDQRLVLQAEHLEEQEEDLLYSWDLAVHMSDHTPASAHDNNECVKADGSSYHNLRTSTNSSGNETNGGGPNTTKPGGGGTANSHPLTVDNKTTVPTGKTSTLATSTTTRPTRGRPDGGRLDVSEGEQEGEGPMSLLYPVEGGNNQGRPPGGDPAPPPPLLDGIKEGPGDLDDAVQEGPSGSRHESGPSASRRAGAADPSPTPPARGDQLHTSASPREARGSGRGSGSGIAADGRRSGDNGCKDHPNQGLVGTQGGAADGVVEGVKQNRSSPHIVNIIRTPVLLRPQQTTTGVHQRALVIKQGVLKQGRTYMIRVRVRNQKTRMTGTAMAYVKVNESPSLGACSLKPDSGTEMKTMFRVVCMEWWDDNTPTGIRYEVSYSLNEGRTQDLVYQGRNHQINFQLPAGGPDHKNIVNVTVSILDKYNARTTVCSQPVHVRPLTFRTRNLTEVEAIYELVGEENSTLGKYISKGDNRNARLHAQLVAHKLNRLPRDEDSAQASLRARIRTTVLHTLKSLPMRDEYEVQQTTSAVATSTAVSEELQERSLQYASDILEKATERMSELATVTKYVDSSIIMVAIQGTSNIMEATSGGVSRNQPNATKSVIRKLQRTMKDLLKTELEYTVVGEEPVRRVTDYLYTYSGRFKARRHRHQYISAEATVFSLPTDLNTILERNQQVKGQPAANQNASDCYETLVVNYRRNPFTYEKGRKVQSQVASLSLFSCDTQAELVVRNLPLKNQVGVALPTVPSEVEHIGNYTLNKHQMNVHQFNVSLDPTDKQSLQVLVQLQPVAEGRLFPIALLLSADRPPTPTKYQYQKVFPASANSLTYFLPPHSLNESTVYYLGVVDADYDASRPRPGEVRVRKYSLRLWRGECVYWDDAHDVWSNAGCSLQRTSTFTTIQCQCNHLTSFGAHFSLVPNDLDFTNIEDFFDLNENPVTFTLVSVMLGVYLLLLVVCIRADLHNDQKGAIVHLIDNVPVDRHRYAITLETGMRRGAGTTAKVSLVLHGQEGMSETRELLSESGQPLFERNSRDTFIITLPDSLGEIWKVQIWHNNAGPSPSWYLSRVVVKDIHAGGVYYFSSEKWFAVEEEDGKVERELLVLEAGLGFVKVMWAKGTQYLTDYHLWFSLLMCPSCSRFTRAQRLTCCLSLALSYTAVNCAWYRQHGTEYRGEVGLIDLSWRALAVGCITSLIVLPVNLLLVFIFRRSKVKRVCIEEPPDRTYHVNKRESVTSLDSTMRLLQPVLTPSIFDQSMLNWQTLQDWAQRQWSKRYQQPSTHGGHEAIKPANQEAECGRKQEYETDQTSSGFEDCLSHDRAGQLGLVDKVARAAVQPAQAHNQPPQQHLERALSRQNEETRLQKQQEMQSHLLKGVRSRKPRRFFLPHCCLYLGWALAIVIILSCASVTILFGFRFGRTKSIMWLQSLFFSFIQCVFITHPVIVLTMSVYTAVKYRADLSVFDHRDDGVIEQQINNPPAKPRERRREDDDVNLAEGIAARQRSRYLRFARPPQEKQLIESRKKIMKEKKAMAVLEESVGVVVLFVLLIVIAFSKDMTSAYRLNKALHDTLAKTGPVPFESLSSTADWYQWTRTALLDAIYHRDGTPPSGRRDNHERMYVGNSAVIGRVNVRQLRVNNELCRLPDKYLKYSRSPICHHGYDYSSRDEKPFGRNETWYYHDSSVTKSTSVRGRHGHYDGGGHSLTLGASRLVSLQRLQRLQDAQWIDENKTRAVIVEFTLYNPPSNLFSSVSLLLELPPTGGVFTQTRTMSAHLYKYTTTIDNVVLACELLLTVVALYKLHCELGEVARLKKGYVKNPWKSVEVVALLLLLAYVSCFIYRFMLVHEVVEVMRATYHEQFVDVAYVSYWDQILHSFLGFIILLVAVQSLRLLRNRKVFAKFGGVYRKAGLELASIGVMFVVWVCAYSCLGGALYGAVTYNFSRLDLALTTVMGLMTGHNSVSEIDLWERVGSQLFLVSFLIFAVGSLTAYMIAVLSFHYKTYQEEGLPSLSTPEAFVFLWNKIRRALAINCKRPSPKEEEEEEETLLPAEFTMAEVEYQVDEMLFKMNALTGCSSLPEKPPNYFTDSDCTYGTGDDGISSGGSEQGRPFDDDRFEHRLQKIEDNLMAHDPHWAQLLKLEAIGANLISQEREKQVRSALEFEIFRQLQIQRGPVSADQRSLPSDNGQVIIHRLSSLSSAGTTASSGGGSGGSGGSSPHGSPTAMATNNKLHKTFSKTSNNASPPPPPKRTTARGGDQRTKTPPGVAPPCPAPSQPSRRDALILQDISENLGGSSPEEGIPLREITLASPPAPPPVPPPAGAPGKTSETILLEDPVSTSSCSSGGAEVQYIVTQGQPKGHTPTEHRSLESLTKAGKGKQAKGCPPSEKAALSYENLYGDTSSGSERDAALRATTKARSLRKTKSRGKGKGRSRLTPVDGLDLDDLGIDNQGYMPERGADPKVAATAGVKVGQKQCWT